MKNGLLSAVAVLAVSGAAMAQTFVNPAPILIPAGAPGSSSGPAAPYPSPIVVSGVSGATSLTVTLRDMTHTFLADLDILLQGPGGTVLLMSDVGGGGPGVTNLSFTFADGSPAFPLTVPTSSGTFAPTNSGTGDLFPAPAPAGPYGTSLNPLAASANGAWNLFVFDDAGGDIGAINGGWSITFVPAPGALALLGLGGLLAGRRRRA